jgi:TetR/AcrR family transcriptional regulator, fatty acid metabolism regulator protein
VSKVATRTRILDGALDVFARKGYHRAIVDDIVRASGTSKGAVYHHFSNKEALFVALVDDFADLLASSVATAIGARHGALAKVDGALTAVLTTFADNERLARLILLEAMSLGPTYQRKRAEVSERFATLIQRYLDEAVADGSLPLVDTRVATLAWLGAVNEVVVQWLHGAVRDLGATTPALTRLLLRSVGSAVGSEDAPVSLARRTPSGSRRRGSRG